MQTLLAQWREADKAAYEAEHIIFDMTMQYTSGTGPRPSDESLEAARLLRLQATALFERVMEKFGQAHAGSGHAPLS